MNATDDGVEPLGEGPIDTLTAIGRMAELNMLCPADNVTATEQLAERQGQALDNVRELHTESTYWKNCRCCHEPWPCGTILAIDSAGA